MDKPELIPVTDLDRSNPMIWEAEEPAQGVFLDTGDSDDPLALLGAPALERCEAPRLPADFRASPLLQRHLAALPAALAQAIAGEVVAPIMLAELEDHDREALRLVLGEGEVTGRLVLDGVNYQFVESVLPGLWYVSGSNGEAWVEVGAVPDVVQRAAASLAPAPVPIPAAVPGVMNGLALLAEVNEHAAAWDGSAEHNRVINFTLLPMSPEDEQLLLQCLGRAELALESGGFGDCRVMATRVRHVWAVQFVNALGNVILDTLEVGAIPDAVLAAPQDLEDSARRLEQLLETYLA